MKEVALPTTRVSTSASVLIRGPTRSTLYDAYADLPRMVEWSPLLSHVTYDTETRRSAWELRVPRPLHWLWAAANMGTPAVTWTAVNLVEEPPCLLRWRSCSGYENEGEVTFEAVASTEPWPVTNMTLCLSYPLPRMARPLLQNRMVQRFIKKTMRSTMLTFADVMESEAAAVMESAAAARTLESAPSGHEASIGTR